MAHEIAKTELEKACTAEQRVRAVRAAMSLGMPLRQIEEYLDWIDSVRNQSWKRHDSHEQPE